MATRLVDPHPQPQLPTIGFQPMSSDELPNFEPRRIIFGRVGATLGPGGLQIRFSRTPANLIIPPDGLKACLDCIDAPPAEAAALEDRSPATPLDLVVTEPAILVFELDRAAGWRFSTTTAALSLKNPADAARYGGLVHVGEGGRRSGAPLPPDAQCRLAYFSADAPEPPFRHGINLHVELVTPPVHAGGREQVLPLIIDPDIRNPGGSGS